MAGIVRYADQARAALTALLQTARAQRGRLTGGYGISEPPLACNDWPVTQQAASDTKDSTAAAMSSRR